MNEIKYDPFAGIPRGSRIMIAFSGGVDSSVAAYLCQKAGMKVLAVSMSLLGKGTFDSARAEKTASMLGIPLEILELSDEFEERIMRYSWNEYSRGRTPNPCAVCNPVFKFGKLQEFAESRGCHALATGHYVRLIRGNENAAPVLMKGVSTDKDQSYFLYGLSREQLQYSCFPLGALTKDEVRAIAAELGLPTAHAPESQDACFTPKDGTSLAEMLRLRFDGKAAKGNFVTPQGKILGRHNGIHAYTIGQRKGTGIALGCPAYVMKIDAAQRQVVITTENQDLLSRKVLLQKANLLRDGYRFDTPFRCEVKIRYRSKAVPALVRCFADYCELEFDEPQRAVTPGQAAVFYDGEILIGGAWIESAGKE
ncbi:MAG: tRNA 2-thiouridine(34) synthase MnmA [Lentisphaeria bacterium]|nr:tRNA 2-thiouridine(34) synthase MnmA [Lentisphaeria bacterium]